MNPNFSRSRRTKFIKGQLSNKRKLFYLLFVLILLSLLFLIIKWFYRPRIEILELNNGEFIFSNYDFLYEVYEQPQLWKLRKQENLEDVVASVESEFEKFILLRNWVTRQWDRRVRRGEKEPYGNALAILKQIREAKIPGGICSEYTIVFMQACLSLGYQCRILSIQSEQGEGHRINEVWFDRYNKWIVMDPYYNLHYERDGEPLNALELHKALVQNNYHDIKIIKGDCQYEDTNLDKEIKLYLDLTVIMRNNHLSWIETGLFRRSLGWVDDFTSGRPDISRFITHRESDLYWTLNQTVIKILEKNPQEGTINIELRTNTPNFMNFAVKFDYEKQWRKKEGTLIWKLHKSKSNNILSVNILSARAINMYGIAGPVATLKVFYKKH